MKAVTIRGVDPEVAEKLKSSAAKQGKSINQVALEMIKEGLGLKKARRFSREYDDMDHLFGRWTEKEFEEIHTKIERERRVDQELWK
jgi:hypothetical protein